MISLFRRKKKLPVARKAPPEPPTVLQMIEMLGSLRAERTLIVATMAAIPHHHPERVDWAVALGVNYSRIVHLETLLAIPQSV